MYRTRWKKITLLYVLVLFVCIISACGDESTKEASGGKTMLNFPTASTTGTIYPLGSAMSNLWGKEVEGISVNAQASNGGVDNLNLMKDGEAQISFATTGIIWEAYNGERGFKDREYKDVRIVAGLYYNPNQLVEIGRAHV